MIKPFYRRKAVKGLLFVMAFLFIECDLEKQVKSMDKPHMI